MSREEILTLLDEPSKFEQLIAFSFLLQRLTHRLRAELDKVISNLRNLPKPMQEKLIAYSEQTKFFINVPVLGVIRETLGLAPALLAGRASPGFFSASLAVDILQLSQATGVSSALHVSVLQRLRMAVAAADLANSSAAAANAAAAAANANAANVIREVSALLLTMSPQQAATAAPLVVAAAGTGQEPSATS